MSETNRELVGLKQDLRHLDELVSQCKTGALAAPEFCAYTVSNAASATSSFHITSCRLVEGLATSKRISQKESTRCRRKTSRT
jgi:methylthioribose-1-phosphate isomerase